MGNTCKPMAVSFQCMTKFTTNKKKKEREREEVPPGAWIGKLRHSRGMWLTISHRKTVRKFRLNFSLLPLAVSTPIIREGKYLNLQSSRCNFKTVHLPQLRSVFPEFSGICLLSMVSLADFWKTYTWQERIQISLSFTKFTISSFFLLLWKLSGQLGTKTFLLNSLKHS